MEFRKDINGLRAIAVIAVVLFHFNAEWLSGGFAGVDVFFVISGYLMTGIIFRGLENNNFSLLKFYKARARRIIPALVILCLALLIFGWFYLTPMDYKALGKHVASSVGFLSNVIYWLESGYFSADSHEKWLLHTWSLSVEWQFYMIYPILLIFLKRLFNLNIIRYMIIVGSVIGFVFCVYASSQWSGFAFYLLPTRAWEMMVGGVAYLFPMNLREMNKKYLEWFGLGLIIFSYITLSSQDVWPGYLSLIPVLGAFLIIQSNRNNSLITGNKFSQKIGEASYSIYLWHWPFMVYFYNNVHLKDQLLVLLFAGCIFIWTVISSFKFIESEAKKIDLFKLTSFLTTLLFVSSIIWYINGVVSNLRGISISDKAVYETKYKKGSDYIKAVLEGYRHECNFFDIDSLTAKLDGIDINCTKKSGDGGVFLWGDSHAQALSYGLRRHINRNIPFYQVASSGCRPRLGDDNYFNGEYKKACDKSNKFAIQNIRKLRPNIVILAQRDDHNETDFEEISSTLKSYGVNHVFIIGPVPQWEFALPKVISKRHWDKNEKIISDPDFRHHLFDLNKHLNSKYNDSDLINYVSIIDALCEKNKCLAKVDNSNTPIVWDYGHLTLEGSSFVVDEVIYPRLKALLQH